MPTVCSDNIYNVEQIYRSYNPESWFTERQVTSFSEGGPRNKSMRLDRYLVEPDGIEPTTSSLPAKRSPS